MSKGNRIAVIAIVVIPLAVLVIIFACAGESHTFHVGTTREDIRVSLRFLSGYDIRPSGNGFVLTERFSGRKALEGQFVKTSVRNTGEGSRTVSWHAVKMKEPIRKIYPVSERTAIVVAYAADQDAEDALLSLSYRKIS